MSGGEATLPCPLMSEQDVDFSLLRGEKRKKLHQFLVYLIFSPILNTSINSNYIRSSSIVYIHSSLQRSPYLLSPLLPSSCSSISCCFIPLAYISFPFPFSFPLIPSPLLFLITPSCIFPSFILSFILLAVLSFIYFSSIYPTMISPPIHCSIIPPVFFTPFHCHSILPSIPFLMLLLFRTFCFYPLHITSILSSRPFPFHPRVFAFPFLALLFFLTLSPSIPPSLI